MFLDDDGPHRRGKPHRVEIGNRFLSENLTRSNAFTQLRMRVLGEFVERDAKWELMGGHGSHVMTGRE